MNHLAIRLSIFAATMLADISFVPGQEIKQQALNDPAVLQQALNDPAVLQQALNDPAVLQQALNDPAVLQQALNDPAVLQQALTRGPQTGSLVIAGGGGRSIDTIMARFIKLAGGQKARYIVIPTAGSSDPDYDYTGHRTAKMMRERFELSDVTVLHTHDPEVADNEAFANPLEHADAVWFTGGRQWRIVDAYHGTLTEKAIRAVLDRGGVIGGSSAGATIQGSFLARGDTAGNIKMIGDHQIGFGYLSNCAIDQHVVARRRQQGLIEVLTDPDGRMKQDIDRESLLGLGIDEDTAIVVQGDQFEVIGKPNGRVLVYNPRQWKPDTPDDKKYETLFTGARFDLAKREKIVPPNELPDPDTLPAAKRCSGFYKEVFVDGGSGLSSRKRLAAAETLGLSYEYYAGKDKDVQNAIISGNDQDPNGALLYPDGQPRFRLVFVGGGGATAHGKSLTRRGRDNLRTFFRSGGSYCGCCAGSFLSGRGVDQQQDRRLGYLHLFPFNTLNTGMKRYRVGHSIPEKSPLLKYRNFGGDRYVADIYHNNGNWINARRGEHLEHAEILATYDVPLQRANRGAAIWAYKPDGTSGRLINIGSHPEGITYGERLELTEACLLYALDGVGEAQVKATLESGKPWPMNKDSRENAPEQTKIGDLQLHHFNFVVTEQSPHINVALACQADVQMNLYLRKDTLALPETAAHRSTHQGAYQSIDGQLSPGTWFVAVECATTVEAKKHSSGQYYEYSGNTSVLAGVAYEITMTAK